jgi:hypothetical protein|tara:strand:- start:765 stop:947 length:183 start_codon:yes stop_codon:yes gene_type:complete
MKSIYIASSDKCIIEEEEDGWYFWYEVGMHQHGPYKDIEEARNMLDKYRKEVLDMKTKEI